MSRSLFIEPLREQEISKEHSDQESLEAGPEIGIGSSALLSKPLRERLPIANEERLPIANDQRDLERLKPMGGDSDFESKPILTKAAEFKHHLGAPQILFILVATVGLVLFPVGYGIFLRIPVSPWRPFGEEALLNSTDVENHTTEGTDKEMYTGTYNEMYMAFLENSTGDMVLSQNLTEAVVYQQMGNGSDGCDDGLQIASPDECRLAIESLGMTVSDTWSGSASDLPPYCSATVVDANTTIANMNSNTTVGPNSTRGRPDVLPVCTTVPKPTGCPACVSSKRIIPSVVIPFFQRDLCKFGFTARSIGIHDPNNFLGDVYFAWISYSSPSPWWGTIQAIIDDLNKTHTVHFYDFSGVVRGGGQAGWTAQQVLKLKMASVITSDYYVVLDSKNTLIKDVQSDTLVSPCNQAITFAAYSAWTLPNPHKGWYYATAGKLGVPWPQGGSWPDSITPMTMYTKTVLSMLHAVGEDPSLGALCRGPLCGWMGSQGATEFILYQLYAYFRTDYKCFHAPSWPIVGSMWRGRTSVWSIDSEAAQGHYFFGAQSGAFGGIWGWARTEAGSHLRQIFVDADLVNESDPAVSPDYLMSCLG